MDKAAHLR